MDLTSYLSQENCLWSRYNCLDTGSLEVSTIWQNDSLNPGRPRSRHEKIKSSAFSTWLESDPKYTQVQNADLVIRIVWVSRDSTEKVMHISDASLSRVIAELGLKDAVKASYTAYAGVRRVPSSLNSDYDRNNKYCFCVHPKIVVAWSFNAEHSLVQGICFAGAEQIRRLRELTEVQWCCPPMTLPLACATMLSMEIDNEQEKLKQQVRTVEVRTGYHNWKSRAESHAPGDLALLSAQMSGAASKLASVARKTSVIEQLLQFSTTNQEFCTIKSRTLDKNTDLSVLDHRIEMHKIDTCFIRQRIEVQLAALYNLIAQNDAVASQSVAKQSKVVAVASQRDSTSMKALAVVTIFFLPGQVVASVFAMPLFNWTAGQANATGNSTVVNSRFGVYWAVTVPLTAFTFIIAAFWFLVEQRRRQRSMLVETEEIHSPLVGHTEIGMLLRRRSTVATTPT